MGKVNPQASGADQRSAPFSLSKDFFDKLKSIFKTFIKVLKMR